MPTQTAGHGAGLVGENAGYDAQISGADAGACERDGADAPAAAPSYGRPSPEDRTISVQREVLGCALQHPNLVALWYDSVEDSAFTWAGFVAVHHAIDSAGRPSRMVDAQWTEQQWLDAVLAASADDTVRSFVRELATRPLPVTDVTG